MIKVIEFQVGVNCANQPIIYRHIVEYETGKDRKALRRYF